VIGSAVVTAASAWAGGEGAIVCERNWTLLLPGRQEARNAAEAPFEVSFEGSVIRGVTGGATEQRLMAEFARA